MEIISLPVRNYRILYFDGNSVYKGLFHKMIMKLQIEFDGDMMLTQVRHLLKNNVFYFDLLQILLDFFGR